MENARPEHPAPAIPGWRVILSDRKRLWASRVVPFTEDEMGAGATRTVDADTLDDLQAEVIRQETAARQATEWTAQTTEQAAQVAGRVTQVPEQAARQVIS
ncbi:hypothetical protein [Streptosporangium sp. NPDC051022]|uniref:hypothetical protein n=1 Tax=Streptosporangium sp. NPDC051022 TaxID=3155752 RepID=UPI00341901DE